MKRLLARIGGGVALVLLVLVAAHVMVPVLHPDQETPEGHASFECAICHIVSDSAEIIEMQEPSSVEN